MFQPYIAPVVLNSMEGLSIALPAAPAAELDAVDTHLAKQSGGKRVNTPFCIDAVVCQVFAVFELETL